MKSKSFKTDIFIAVVFLVLGITTRTIYHIGPNVEFITAITLLGAYLFHKRSIAFITTLAIMVITDLFIGNTRIFLFTWSGFALTFIWGLILRVFDRSVLSSVFAKLPDWKKVAGRASVATSGGIVSVLIFYLWTNFGVVVLGSMYEKNIYGLFHSYINALPFLRNQLLGNIVIIPCLYLLTTGLVYVLKHWEFVFTPSGKKSSHH